MPPKDCPPHERGEECKETPSVDDYLNPKSKHYWNFKPAALPGDSILDCSGVDEKGISKKDGPQIYLQKVNPTVSTIGVPDPNHIYSVKMSPDFLDKLKATLELSVSGSPTAFAATASSSGTEMVKLAGAAFGRYAALKTNDNGIPGFMPRFKRMPPPRAKESPFSVVLNRLADLEETRIALLKGGNANQASLDGIAAEQARLRKLIEGGVREETFTYSFAFDPSDVVDKKKISGTDPADTIKIPKGELCPKAATKANLHLDVSTQSSNFVNAQKMGNAKATNGSASTVDISDGFRYRVPVFAIARIDLKQDGPIVETASELKQDSSIVEKANEEGKQGPSIIPGFELPGTHAVAQWGTVRVLPRRIGIGSGALSASFDPITGALKSLTNDGEGGGYQMMISAIGETKKDHEAEALEKEVKELKMRQDRCKLRSDLGLSLPSDCPTTTDGSD